MNFNIQFAKPKVLLIILLLLLNILNISTHLMSVININRHGARTPSSFDKLTEKIYYETINMQLIINGYQQHQLLGAWIKQRYINNFYFLNDEYDPNESIFYSSPYQRAIFSAAAFLKGLYDDYEIKHEFSTEKSNFAVEVYPPIEDVNWGDLSKEITLNIKNSYDDNIFNCEKCKLTKDSKNPIIDELFIKTEIFPEATNKEIVDAIDDIYKKIPYLFKDKSPAEIYNIKYLEEVNKFITEFEPVLNNQHLFSNKTEKLLRQLNIQKMYGAKIAESDGVKLSASGFFEEILNNLESSYSRDQDMKKFILYSGHDGNIISIFSNLLDRDYLLKICREADQNETYYNFLLCPFASSLIFELYSPIDFMQKYFVKIIYNGEEIKTGLNKSVIYDESIGGYEYYQFKNFIKSRIDLRYKSVYCNINDDIDYTKVNN